LGESADLLPVGAAIATDELRVIEATPHDYGRMAELLTTYASLRLQVVDACVIALAERLDVREVGALDRRDFLVEAPRHLRKGERRVFPGGCFFVATALEMGTRPGPVKDRVAAIQSGFTALLRAFAAIAVEQHELPAREDPDRLAFELHAILLGADTKFVLHDDPAVLELARRAVRQRLGLDNGSNDGGS
jgi:hypothetical protein